MLTKVLTLPLVLYVAQVLAGSIKAPLSPEVQNVVRQIDMKAILLENEIRQVSFDQKLHVDRVKVSTKMALKTLKDAVKEGKGTLCGEIASVEAKQVEIRAKDVKSCRNRVSFKELQRELSGYLKNLNAEAQLIDKYCAFVNSDVTEAAKCVTASAAELMEKLVDVESVIAAGLGRNKDEDDACYRDIVEDIEGETTRIVDELHACMKASAKDDSSESHSSENSKSCSCSEDSNEASEAPEETSTAGGGNTEESSSVVAGEQITVGDDSGENGNASESITNVTNTTSNATSGVTNEGSAETTAVSGPSSAAPSEIPIATEETPIRSDDDGEPTNLINSSPASDSAEEDAVPKKGNPSGDDDVNNVEY